MEFYKKLGQRIRVAREAARLSQEALGQAAGKLSGNSGYSGSAIWNFETGNRKLQLEDLPYFAAALGVPVSYFLGPDTQSSAPDETTWASVLLRATAFISPALRDQIKEFVEHFLADVSHIYLEDELQGVWPLHPDDLLTYLGVEPPIDSFRIAERCGVRVIPWEFGSEVSGLLVQIGHIKAIGVNQHHPDARQRFTVAHELGHYFLRHTNEMTVDLVDPLGDTHFNLNPVMERQANRFAAQLLMPERHIRLDFRRFGGDLDILRLRYQVSEQALWIRLSELRLVETANW